MSVRICFLSFQLKFIDFQLWIGFFYRLEGLSGFYLYVGLERVVWEQIRNVRMWLSFVLFVVLRFVLVFDKFFLVFKLGFIVFRFYLKIRFRYLVIWRFVINERLFCLQVFGFVFWVSFCAENFEVFSFGFIVLWFILLIIILV